MEESLSPRQVYAFCMTALSAPMVTVCAGLPWPWVLALSVFAVAVETGLLVLWRAAGSENLPHVVLRVWGRPAGAAIMTAQAVFALTILWRFLWGMDTAFPESPTMPFVPLTLLAAVAWSAWHGRAAVIRAMSVLFFFLAVLYLVVIVFAFPDARWSRLRTWDDNTSLLPAAVLLLPTYGLYLTRPRQGKRRLPGWWMLLLILLPTVVSVVCAAVPGSRGSFYEMAKSVEVFSVAQRMEPLVSALLTLGWFAAASLLTLSVGEMADAMGLSPRVAAVGFCAFAAPGAVWDLRISDSILACVGAVFCVLFPLLTLLLGVRKKVKKI